MTTARSVSFVLAIGAVLAVTSRAQQNLSYPKAAKGDVVDVYHGVEVPDPYRWLEDPDSAPSRDWIDAQNALTRRVIDAVPEREALERRLTQLWNFPKRSPSEEVGAYRVYSHNDGLQNQSVLYRVREGGVPEVLLDPNTLSADGTVALAGVEFSSDGRHLAYSLSSGGSDWQVWHVRSVETGIDLGDVLEWSKFSSVAWSPDGAGFYYCRYPAPREGQELEQANFHQSLWYHRLGDPQERDRMVYERPDHPDWGFSPTVTEDGRYLVLMVWKGTDRRNLVFYRPLDAAAVPMLELVPEFKADFNFLGNVGSVFYFTTGDGAPQGRVMAVDIESDAGWSEVVPEAPERLESAKIIHQRLILTSLKDAAHRVRIHHLDGRFERELPLPGLGSVGGFTGKQSSTSTSFTFSSFLAPPTVFRYDLESGTLHEEYSAQVDFPFTEYETRRLFARSKDGTAVPFFLVGRKGMELDGSARTILYGYGGFNISLSPSFSVANLVWLEHGGVYAMAVLRGGSEYGESWHEAGMLHNKQNVFDDFQAVGQYLVDEHYTAPERLVISGGSNGGLLVGACLNQRPDLYAAALPAVGVMDMLRFQEFTIGWAWVPEYGSSADPRQFETLLGYSPLHNLRQGVHYPAVLITTGDHDDRVVPAHSFKYAARLQAVQSGSRPTLIRIETRAGHGSGKPTAMQIEEWADKWAFAIQQTRGR